MGNSHVVLKGPPVCLSYKGKGPRGIRAVVSAYVEASAPLILKAYVIFRPYIVKLQFIGNPKDSHQPIA